MRIRGFETADGYIENFVLRKNFGEHSICEFKMSVADNGAQNYLQRVGQPVGVTLDDKNPYPIFFGEVQNVTLERTFSRTCIEVSAVSYSKKIDEENYTRIFQNPKKTFGEILNPARLKLKNCGLKVGTKISALKYENILLQFQETDFNFIKRLAEYSGTRLWVTDINEGLPAVTVDFCLSDYGKVLPFEKIFSLRAGRNKNSSTVAVVTEEYLPFGGTVFIGGSGKYLVTGFELRLIHGTEKFTYTLEEFKSKLAEINPVPIEKTVKLKAHVTSTKDPENFGRVQVKVDDAEDEDANKIWLPYRSPYSGKGGGIVFFPDEGDAVELIFTNGECFVNSTLREKVLPDECKKVIDKYIGNNTEQRIFWKEKSLEFFSFKNKIYLDKDKIELVVDKNKITIDADGITFETPKNKIALTSSGVDVKAGGKVNIKGSTVNLN